MYGPFLICFLKETLLLEPMFEVPGSEIVGVHVTEEYVKGEKGPDYIKSAASDSSTPEEEDLNTSIRVKQ